jgi:hypothetical protein
MFKTVISALAVTTLLASSAVFAGEQVGTATSPTAVSAPASQSVTPVVEAKTAPATPVASKTATAKATLPVKASTAPVAAPPATPK